MKNAGNEQARNSYFTPAMSMSIDKLLYDESKDLEHWKSWSDDKWIAKMRDRLPLTNQTRDHIADCNQLIDKLVLEVVYSKEYTESKYIEELLRMEIEIVRVYITDQREIDNLVDRLIRRVGKEANTRPIETTLIELQTHLLNKKREKKLASIPRYCGEVTNWLYNRREEYRTWKKRNFDASIRGTHHTTQEATSRDRDRSPKPSSQGKRKDKGKTKSPSRTVTAVNRDSKQCDGCGKMGHLRADCRMMNIHPDFHKS